MSSNSVANGLKRAASGVGVAGSGRRPPGAPRKRRRKLNARAWTLIAFAAPAVFLLLLINLYPVIYAALQSLRNGSLVNPGDFIGFGNYVEDLVTGNIAGQFWQAALFTLIFTVVGVFGSWLVGLALALLLRTHIPGNTVFKVLLLLPWIVPVVVSSFSWNWLVATPQSPFPMLAQSLGLGNVLFLANPVLAQVTVCVFKVWISFPFMMMMMSSALASVDINVYEAAKVDGAGNWATFRLITLPLVLRPTLISWILMTIFCVNDFPTIYLLTQGGPVGATTSLVVLAYRTVFANFQLGQGVSIAFLTTLVLIIISVVLYRQIRKANVE